MPPIRRPFRLSSAVLALSLALGACVDHDPVGPLREPGATPARDVGIEAFTGRIRIGVVPAAGSVAIGSGADYEIRDKATGALVMSGSNGTATVTLQSVIKSWYRLQVMCGSAGAVATRKAAAEAKGYPTFTEFVATANCTRLFIGRFDPPPASNFAARNAFRNQMIAEGLAGTDSFWAVKADPGVTVYRVTRGGTSVDANNPVVLTSSDGLVTIGGVRYRGTAEVRVNGAGTLAGVNELPMEEYLYGVVPRELGPTVFPELEALKAQAVAARTYALSGLGKRASDGYDLLATTSDQVYGGYDAEHPMSTQAVDETAGIAALYDGKLITALYSSTTGGHTADNEEAFNSAPVPYLRGVPDAERGQAFEHVPSLDVFRSHANAASLRNAKEGDFESDWARYHRWTFEWSAAEISEVISAYAGQDVGKVLAINVTERGPSGRALAIEYVTEAGTFTDTKDHIRTSLKFINASGAQQSLLSTLFFIEPVLDKHTGEVDGFVAYGGGFGHGVGLSQTGAVGMAEKGHGYEEILKHYYQGIELAKWY
ncbi:MAG TPA: SpoIID/LytB domain-containing protein [Longimicrobium sp.]|nr:SpoIID/LytB domain-containing protein [Longimicrobium sp.]